MDTGHYAGYPRSKPFIHNSYERDEDKPIKAFPESNNEAVRSALLNLQAKILNLEKDRSQQHRDEDNHSYHDRHSVLNGIGSHTPEHSRNGLSHLNTQDLEKQLGVAESRCHLLEKQLDYMHGMVAHAEKERKLKYESPSSFQPDTHAAISDDEEEDAFKFKKINDLEKEHMHFAASQVLAEHKLRNLENKLKEEKHYREQLQRRTEQMETKAEADRLLDELDSEPVKLKRTHKRKHRKVAKKSTLKEPRSEPMDHYHLNLADIPFVAGKSTTPSYSVPVNIQQVLGMMKCHNAKLCTGEKTKKIGSKQHHHSSTASSTFSSAGDLNDLVTQLQDEFGHLSMEHQELSRHLYETSDPYIQEDISRDLDKLVLKMEVKGDQIAKLRRHKEQTELKKLTSKQTKNIKNSRKSAKPRHPPIDAEIRWAEMASKKQQKQTCQEKSPNTAKDLLYDLRQIQTRLRKDDIDWE